MKSTEFQRTRKGKTTRGWLCFPDIKPRGLMPAAILCHGIPGSKPNPSDSGYLPLAKLITSSGFACALFNFSGCGMSTGNIDLHSWCRDLRFVVDTINDTPGIDPGSIHCIGFSAGGAVASKVVSENRDIASLLMMASPSDFSVIMPDDPALLEDHFRNIGIIKDPDFPQDRSSWYNDFLEFTPTDWMPAVAPRPLMLVHGSDDELVPVSHAQKLFDTAREPKTLRILDGADHHLRKDPRVPEIITDWLENLR